MCKSDIDLSVSGHGKAVYSVGINADQCGIRLDLTLISVAIFAIDLTLL